MLFVNFLYNYYCNPVAFMEQSERHQRFIKAVESLRLKFPGRQIAQQTGYGKATVSAYLGEREPSENFVKTFCEHFGQDFAWIWLGKRAEPKKEEPSPAGRPGGYESRKHSRDRAGKG